MAGLLYYSRGWVGCVLVSWCVFVLYLVDTYLGGRLSGSGGLSSGGGVSAAGALGVGQGKGREGGEDDGETHVDD